MLRPHRGQVMWFACAFRVTRVFDLRAPRGPTQTKSVARPYFGSRSLIHATTSEAPDPVFARAATTYPESG